MIVGGDTGILFGLAEGTKAATLHWQRIAAGEDDLLLSPLSLCEFLVHQYKRGKGDTARRFLARVCDVTHVHVVPVEGAIAERAAGYRHSLDVPTVDAFILATFVSQGCDLVLSTDGHFRSAGERGIVPVEMLA